MNQGFFDDTIGYHLAISNDPFSDAKYIVSIESISPLNFRVTVVRKWYGRWCVVKGILYYVTWGLWSFLPLEISAWDR
jgi:hypothetical protein